MRPSDRTGGNLLIERLAAGRMAIGNSPARMK